MTRIMKLFEGLGWCYTNFLELRVDIWIGHRARIKKCLSVRNLNI